MFLLHRELQFLITFTLKAIECFLFKNSCKRTNISGKKAIFWFLNTVATMYRGVSFNSYFR